MNNKNKTKRQFNKVVILDSVVFYPHHREMLNKLSKEVVEYPSSLPENIEKQYKDNPELFKDLRCYTEMGVNNVSVQLLKNRIEGADCIISCWTNIPDEVLLSNPDLKVIVFWTHEKNHRINLELAESLGIKVYNIADYGTGAVSELVFNYIYELANKNSIEEIKNDGNIANAVTLEIYNKFRKLRVNEKNTRKGKFTHQFHKLGDVTFDFSKGVDRYFSEKVVKNKKVGLLNYSNKEMSRVLNAHLINSENIEITDFDTADFYSFVNRNDIVVIDSSVLNEQVLTKLRFIVSDKIIDINELNVINVDYNKTFGIIGMGRIGVEVAKTAKQLGYKIIYYSRTRKQEVEQEIGIEYSDLDTLLKLSDIISLNTTSHQADNLINSEKVKLIKDGAIFINTSDGNAVDNIKLIERAENNEILLALDVYPGLPRKDILQTGKFIGGDWKLKDYLNNHVLTYRAGWKTYESVDAKTLKLIGYMFQYLAENNK